MPECLPKCQDNSGIVRLKLAASREQLEVRSEPAAPCIENSGSILATSRCKPSVVKLKLDLHEIYNRGDDIDRALRAIIDEAIEKKVRLVEIIPGKGSGQLKKRVLRFLDQKEIKSLYDRVEKDSHNFGRVFVHFRPK